MIDIEAIGISVDTSGVTKGARDLDAFGRSADTASKKADKLGDMYDRTGRKITDSSVRMAKATEDNARALRNMDKSVQSAHASMLKFYAVIGGGAAIGAFLRSVVNAEVQLQKLNNTLKFATGSATTAAAELAYLRATTERLGLEFNSTASAYAKFAAAAKGTSVEGNMARQIFESLAKASTVLGLSADETEGALRAVQQMISKGTVASEELRGQLGERLPGAFQIAARAMGVTTMELGKMLEQGQVVSDVFLPKFATELNRTLGDNPDSAAQSALAQLNRLSNAWTEFKTAAAESGVMTIVLKIAEGSTNAIKWFDHFVFNKGELADLQRAQGTRRNLEILRDRRKSLGSSMFASDSELRDLDAKIRNIEVQLNPSLRNPNAIPGLPQDDSVLPLLAGSQASYSSGKDTGGGYGSNIKNIHESQAEAVRKHAAEVNRLTSAKKQLEEAEASYLKKSMEGEAQMIEADKRFLDQQNDVLDSLLREVGGYSDLSKTEQMLWEIEKGRFKDFTEWHKERILAAAKEIDAQKKIADLQEQANKNFKAAQEEAARLANESRDAQLKMWESIEKTAHDTFVSIFDSGKSAFDRLRDTLKNGLLDLLYQMTLKKWIISISAAVTSTGAAGTAAASSLMPGGAGGISGGSFGALKSVFDVFTSGFETANNALLAGINDFGASVANLGGMFGDIGGWIGQYSGTIAAVAPFVPSIVSILSGDVKGGIASGIGAGIGYYFGGPIGGAIGSFLGSTIGGLFGEKQGKPDAMSSAVIDTLTGKATINRRDQNDGGNSKATADMTVRIAEQFAGIVGGLGGSLKSSGGFAPNIQTVTRDGNITFAMLDDNNKGKTKFGKADVVGKFISAKNDAAVQERVADTYVHALKKFADLPDYLAKAVTAYQENFTDKIDAATSSTNFLNFLNGLKSLHDAMGLMPPLFDKLKFAVDGITDSQTLAAVNAQVSALSTFYSLFYSQQEQFDFSAAQLKKSFASLNLALPGSREAYRALVEGIDTTNQSGTDLFNTLVAMAPTMDGYYKALQDQASATSNATDSINEMLDALSTDRFRTLVDYTRAQRYIENGLSTAGIPGFADGGTFGGGLRVVGENGPELEFTGPSRIISNRELMSRLRDPQANNAALVAEIKALRAELKAANVAQVQAAQKTAKILDKFDNEGIVLSETNNSGDRVVLDTRTVT